MPISLHHLTTTTRADGLTCGIMHISMMRDIPGVYTLICHYDRGFIKIYTTFYGIEKAAEAHGAAWELALAYGIEFFCDALTLYDLKGCRHV